MAAAARIVASLSRIITYIELGAHANNASAGVLVSCADLEACITFTHSLPCVCSIQLQSSSNHASSVVWIYVRRTVVSCIFPQLPCG